MKFFTLATSPLLALFVFDILLTKEQNSDCNAAEH